MASIFGAIGSLVGLGPDAPEWKDANFEGMDVNDPRLYMKGPGANAFGQNVARENMNRYGFQGVYQKFLSGENQRMKDEEGQRIMKMASNLVPGAASLRSGVAAQGLGGSISNVIANQQRSTITGKALDAGFSAMESSNNRLDSQFLTMTGENEKMRFGASQDLMKNMGLQTTAEMDVDRTNTGHYGDYTQFNTQGEWDALKFNTSGRIGQENAEYESTQGLANSLLSGGMGMLGGMLGRGGFPGGGGSPSGGGGYQFGGSQNFGNMGQGWTAPNFSLPWKP
jgi:uncharacterized membrane protein YgcG